MSLEITPIHLPDYQNFSNLIAALDLPFSSSELHGIMCGYLCAGAAYQGETYLRALTSNKKDKTNRAAALAIFEIYTISQQQLGNFDFGFELLLPREYEPLIDRAQAFSEWCEGFTQTMILLGITSAKFQEEESQQALHHLQEFAQLDYESLEVDEEDEKALMEVNEYARMAVIRLYSDLMENGGNCGSSMNSTH